MSIRAHDIVAGYHTGKTVVQGMSLTAHAGEVTTLMGPNGCGKSTFLKTLSRLHIPASGRVMLGGEDIHCMSAREAAKRVSLLSQHPVSPPGLTVGELVERGRHPHRRHWWSASSAVDRDKVAEALEITDTGSLVDRDVQELSGGQRQRVWLAMVLAQDTPVVLLDEPTTYLDPAHAMDILALVRNLARSGKAVVMVLHDLMLAGSYSDQVVVMSQGQQIASGSPAEALRPEVLREAFGLDAEVWEDPQGTAPVIVPRSTTNSTGRDTAAKSCSLG